MTGENEKPGVYQIKDPRGLLQLYFFYEGRRGGMPRGAYISSDILRLFYFQLRTAMVCPPVSPWGVSLCHLLIKRYF